MFQNNGFNENALFRTTFSKVIANGCDREFFNPIVIGAGMGVSQSGGLTAMATEAQLEAAAVALYE